MLVVAAAAGRGVPAAAVAGARARALFGDMCAFWCGAWCRATHFWAHIWEQADSFVRQLCVVAMMLL